MELLDFNLLISTFAGKIVLIFLLFLLAWIVFRLSGRLAKYILGASRITTRQPAMRPERRQTLMGLIAGAITFTAFAVAAMLSLSLFVDGTTLIWMVGLLSAGFGFGSRAIISDFLSGISFMFEDSFDVSEKVELPGLAAGSVMGAVEAVNLRTTTIRSMSGEPFVVPNGEIRVVRNFSRGHFSTANVKIMLATADLGQAIPLLEALGDRHLPQRGIMLHGWAGAAELIPRFLELPVPVYFSVSSADQLELIPEGRLLVESDASPDNGRTPAFVSDFIAENRIDAKRIARNYRALFGE